MTDRTIIGVLASVLLLSVALGMSILRIGGIYWEWLVLLALANIAQARRSSFVPALSFLGAWTAWSVSILWVPDALRHYGQMSTAGGWFALLVVAAVQALPFGALALLGNVGTSQLKRSLLFALAYAVCESWWPWFAPYSASVSLVDTFIAHLLGWGGRAFIAGSLAFLAARAVREKGAFRVVLSALPLLLPCLVVEESSATQFAKAVLVQVPEDDSTFAEQVFRRHAQNTAQLVREEFAAGRLIFWGERASPKRASEKWHRDRVGHLLRPRENLLFGATVRSRAADGAHNSVLVVGECERCRYDKQLLVPFAEVVPSWMTAFFSSRGDDFLPGGGDGGGVLVSGTRIGVRICYEGMFFRTYDHLARWGAGFVFNPVSERWIASSSGRRGHRALTRLAAAEAGLPLVRLVTGGPSEVFSSTGKVLASVAGGRESTLSVEVPIALRVREKGLVRQLIRWFTPCLFLGLAWMEWRSVRKV